MKLHRPPFMLKELKIELTHDCKLQCIHCSSMAVPNSQRTMSWHDCERIINEAADMGVSQIAFSGGEPLLWKHLKDAVNLSSKHGMKIFLYTTGNVHDAGNKLFTLQARGLEKVMFSIFGTNETDHDTITQIPGSFKKSLDVVQYCIAIGLNVEFHFVPLANNYQSLKAIAELAKNLEVSKVSVLRLVPQGRAAGNNDQLLTREQNLHLKKIISSLKDNGHNIRTGSPYNFLMLRERPECCSGIDRLTIGPGLDIFPCDAFKHISPKILGISDNLSCLKNNSLKECWEGSPYLAMIRKYLTTPFAEPCNSCNSLEKCLSGCLAQKFHLHNELCKCPDPMCLKK